MKSQFMKRLGRKSHAKEKLFNVYYECFEKWMRRGIYRDEPPFVPSKELAKANVRYFKYKHLFVAADTPYFINEKCKQITQWNPHFIECAMHLFNTGYQCAQALPCIRRHEWKLDNNVSLSYSYTVRHKHFFDWVKGKIDRGETFNDHYVRRPHRLYTRGMSMQYIPSDMRNHFMPNHNDYDFQNCHWSIFAQTQHVDKQYKECLQPMIDEPVSFMKYIAKESGRDVKYMKTKRNAIIYGDKRGTGSKTLNNIRNKHQAWLIENHKEATELFSDITSWETKALEESITECNPDLLMYDGWMTKESINIQAVQQRIKDNIGIDLTIIQKRAA